MRRLNDGVRVVATVCALVASMPAQALTCPPAKGQTVQIDSVDIHLEARLKDGRKLKFAGIDPPRGTASNAGLGEEARRFLASLLSGRAIVAQIGQDAPDRWGRWPVAADLDGTSIAGTLIAAGWARVDPASAPADCLGAFLEWEAQARRSQRGLWADPAYAVIPATQKETFAGRGGEIVIVEGAVTSVGQWRTLTFLNLGDDRRADPSVVLSRKVVGALERSDRHPNSLTGARIRVRGLLQLRPAPRIEIFSPGGLEIIAAGPQNSNPSARAPRR